MVRVVRMYNEHLVDWVVMIVRVKWRCSCPAGTVNHETHGT